MFYYLVFIIVNTQQISTNINQK